MAEETVYAAAESWMKTSTDSRESADQICNLDTCNIPRVSVQP